MMQRTNKEAIMDIEEMLETSKKEKITSKDQAFYILGRLNLYTEFNIISMKEHEALYNRMCKQFNFTLEDFNSILI